MTGKTGSNCRGDVRPSFYIYIWVGSGKTMPQGMWTKCRSFRFIPRVFQAMLEIEALQLLLLGNIKGVEVPMNITLEGKIQLFFHQWNFCSSLRPSAVPWRTGLMCKDKLRRWTLRKSHAFMPMHSANTSCYLPSYWGAPQDKLSSHCKLYCLQPGPYILSIPFWLPPIREASKGWNLFFISLQLSLWKSTSLLSFLSFEGQFIPLGLFNFKLKYDRKKFLCSPKCDGVGKEKKTLLEYMKQYFSFTLLPLFITIFYPLLETEVFQRAVTPVNIFLKDFILQITWLGDNLIRNSTFTVVLY